MEYYGKLYGKLWNKYFELPHTTHEWDAMEKRIAELEEENGKLKEEHQELKERYFKLLQP